MKKKIIMVLFALLLIIPFMGVSAKEKAKVKVYVFEAGGCPYCEAEVEYLQGLDSYNKKFTIERRELYVDHVYWEQGRDYKLGKAVAEKFIADGFSDASYEGTPFIVISNLYAAATYDTNLESYINKAYKEGDKDVVNQIAKKLGVENVQRNDIKADDPDTTDTTEDGDATTYSGEKPNVVIVLIGAVVLVGAMIVVIKLGGNKGEEATHEVEEVKEEVEEAPVKKTPVKKLPVKKTTPKKAPAKKTTKRTNKR